ncbi:MAG: long-chain-fatty-acid--CoA ligase [Alphaproteobacteria bacterium]
MHLTQGLKRNAQIYADTLATHDGERSQTWRECEDRVARIAGGLRRMGVSDGERVAVLALNSDHYFEYFFAVPWAGGVFVPINIRLAPPEIAYWLNDSGSEILFVDDNFLDAVKALDGMLETVREFVYMGDGATPAGMRNLESLLEDPIPDAERGYEDLAGLFYTGGTTGRSKGVMLSHRNLVSNSYHIIPSMFYRPGMRYLHAPPMFHIADGLAVFGVTMVGGSHIFISGFTPDACLNAIEQYRVTDTLLVPTMMNMLVNHPDVENRDLSSLESIVYGASPMPEAVVRRALDVIPGVKFTHAYGQTECAPLSTCNGPEAHVLEGPKAGLFKSAGRSVLGVEVRILDDDDNEVLTGEVGQVCVRGPNVMLGYWKLPELTAETLRGGWMHSGDGGYMDENGYVYIVDRMKDMIITGGENVYSAEVENTLHQHSAVAEAAVIGVPDEKWGERVHAIVRLRDGARCHTLIAGFKCPRSISFQDEPLPLSGAGKILKTTLRQPFWENQDRQVH